MEPVEEHAAPRLTIGLRELAAQRFPWMGRARHEAPSLVEPVDLVADEVAEVVSGEYRDHHEVGAQGSDLVLEAQGLLTGSAA